VADTQWRIHNGGYTVADTQRQIYSGRYTAAPNQDTQWWTHSRSLSDLPDITSPPWSTFRILGAAKPPPVLVEYTHTVLPNFHIITFSQGEKIYLMVYDMYLSDR
jgi:hypothetical protein